MTQNQNESGLNQSIASMPDIWEIDIKMIMSENWNQFGWQPINNNYILFLLGGGVNIGARNRLKKMANVLESMLHFFVRQLHKWKKNYLWFKEK